jgi:hypothetical protein
MKSLSLINSLKLKKNIFHVTLFTNPKIKAQPKPPPFQTLKNRLPNNRYIWKDILLTVTLGYTFL